MGKSKVKLKSKSKSKSNFITVKTSLKSILRDYDLNYPIINQLVIDCHVIITRTYQFIRLYLLYQFRNNKPLPSISKSFILSCIRIGGQVSACGRKPKNTDLENDLKDFYQREFQPCLDQPKYDLKYKSFILPYLAVQIQTSFDNNTKEHFLTRIRTVMNLTRPESLTDDKLFKKIKNLILSDHHDSIPTQFQVWSGEIKDQYLPSIYQNCYGYDIKIDPDKYLPYMIKLNQTIELRNQSVIQSQLSDDDKRGKIHKLFQPIPIRTSKIPCYITLDANSIVSIFYTKDKAKTGQHIADHRQEVWSSLFKTDKKVMRKKGYHFCSIQTDGVGVSICFQKDGLSIQERHLGIIQETPKMLEDLTPLDIQRYKSKTLIGCDPSKQSAIYMMDQSKKHLRYTPRQRQSESKTHRCREIMNIEKEKYGIVEAETTLSHYNNKTVDYQQFKEYIGQEQLFHQKTDNFYHQKIWRKMKWRTWINRRSSEDRFLNRIEDMYGHPDDLLLCYGNWSQTAQMKYLMPSQGVGLRRLIGKRFEIVMVDEYRTSKLCNQCHEVLESQGNLYRVRLCRNCKDNRSESKCWIFNRDANACMNILFLTREWLHGQVRPEKYKRSTLLTAMVEIFPPSGKPRSTI